MGRLLVTPFFVYALLTSTHSFAEEEKANLQGWTVYSKDPDFDLKKLKEKGVIERNEVTSQKNPFILYSYDICLRKLSAIIKPSKILEVEEVQQICHRSLNYKENIFLAMYRNTYDEAKLKIFRTEMHETFAKK